MYEKEREKERARTAYLEEAQVILINSVGGRDDGAHRLFHSMLRYEVCFPSHSRSSWHVVCDIARVLLVFRVTALIKTLPGCIFNRHAFLSRLYVTLLCARISSIKRLNRAREVDVRDIVPR